MDGLGTAGLRGGDDPLDVQVALRRRPWPDQPRLIGAPHVQRAPIGLGIHGHGSDPKLPQSPKDPNGDLAAIGDEHLAKQRSHGRGSLERMIGVWPARAHDRGLARTLRV